MFLFIGIWDPKRTSCIPCALGQLAGADKNDPLGPDAVIDVELLLILIPELAGGDHGPNMRA